MYVHCGTWTALHGSGRHRAVGRLQWRPYHQRRDWSETQSHSASAASAVARRPRPTQRHILQQNRDLQKSENIPFHHTITSHPCFCLGGELLETARSTGGGISGASLSCSCDRAEAQRTSSHPSARQRAATCRSYRNRSSFTWCASRCRFLRVLYG